MTTKLFKVTLGEISELLLSLFCFFFTIVSALSNLSFETPWILAVCKVLWNLADIFCPNLSLRQSPNYFDSFSGDFTV